MMKKLSAAGFTGKAVGALKAGLIVLALVGLVFVASPKPAQSQCEPSPVMASVVAAQMAAQFQLILTFFTTSSLCPGSYPPCGVIGNAYAVIIEATQAAVIALIEAFELALLNRLREFWNDWFDALRDQTAQLSGSMSDGTRHLNSLFDSSDETETARKLQETEHTAKKQYQATNQGCRFDTVGKALGSTMRTGKAVAQGMGKNLNVVANNNTSNVPSTRGQAGLLETRWNVYVQNFCDTTSNGGYPGCTTAGAAPNADVLPSRTIFGKETIDLTDVPTQRAVQALVYNITGHEIPDPMLPDVLRTPAGREQRARNREHLAQMDAASALVTSLIGERTPLTEGPGGGPAARTEVQALRMKLGVTDASEYPSERELRQVVVEQLWDPNYWVELGDSPSTTTQKEVYLQAYNLLMLYKIIEKTEKIANAYAVQTANMLERTHGMLRQGAEAYTPMR